MLLMLSEREIDKAIQRLNEEIDQLNAQRKVLNDLGDPMKLADVLHEIDCHWNHTDGCGWYYESWEGVAAGKWRNGTKEGYLEKAKKVLAVVNDYGIKVEDAISLFADVKKILQGH